MANRQTISIVSRKYDGSYRFRLEVDLLYASASVLLGLGRPGRPMVREVGESAPDNWSLEYLPLDKPYNIVSVFDLEGALKHHFCNVITPPRLEVRGQIPMSVCSGSQSSRQDHPPDQTSHGTLSYIDLDLDVVVWPDGTYTVEDRDQFERNAVLMGYPSTLQELALGALDELTGMAMQGGHLFSRTRLDEARAQLLALYAERAET